MPDEIAISQFPASLPAADLVTLTLGVSILPPLSRRRRGPGLIVLVPNSSTSLDIKSGVPSNLIKWAEEGYAVLEIQEQAFRKDIQSLLKQAVEEISKLDMCEPKGEVGLIAYDPRLWNQVAPFLVSIPEIVATVIYTSASSSSALVRLAVPQIQHISGKSPIELPRTENLVAYDYPSTTSFLFASPFQPHFNYSAEAISHTRNLTFLKRHMQGPYFDLEKIWDEHTYFEFEDRSVEHTMATMVQEPYVNHIPTITGGIGREKLSSFYRNHFIWKNPGDTEMELISRTVGIDRVVDEFIFKFTHNSEVDWLIPGIPPTFRKLEIPFTAVVNIRGDRLYHEHIAWDQGTVLVQLGLMPEFLPFPYTLPDGKKPTMGKSFEFRVPVAGTATAIKMREKNTIPSNEMFHFKIREV